MSVQHYAQLQVDPLERIAKDLIGMRAALPALDHDFLRHWGRVPGR